MNGKDHLRKRVHHRVVTLQISRIQEALQDFLLCRQAMRCTPATPEHYGFTAGRFVEWLERQGISLPAIVNASHVRAWLREYANKLKPASLHARARGVRTLLKFWDNEGYLSASISGRHAKVGDRTIAGPQPRRIEDSPRSMSHPREKALVLLLADSGIRSAEALGLHWEDINFTTGTAVVRRGKGGKFRVSAVCAMTMRALPAYRRSLHSRLDPASPVWVSKSGKPLGVDGVKDIFQRLS